MIETLEKMEASLRSQLSSLVEEIRAAESSLISTKEGYLKVQGALEIIDILKKEFAPSSSEENVDVALE